MVASSQKRSRNSGEESSRTRMKSKKRKVFWAPSESRYDERGKDDDEAVDEDDDDDEVAYEDEDEDATDEDDKLYCICRTKYDEDRVMIACDR